LIRAHHHQFLLTLHQNHIAIYHFSKFASDADEKFLPIYTYADKQNQKIINLVEFSEVFLSRCKLAKRFATACGVPNITVTPIVINAFYNRLNGINLIRDQKITNLVEFSEVFLSRCKLAKMINRYMVLVQSEQKLMMMRP
jgi:hypothetical protein